MKKVCPRCGATFECRHEEIVLCHCAAVKLNAVQREYLRSHYSDCLCHNCLLLIQATVGNDATALILKSAGDANRVKK